MAATHVDKVVVCFRCLLEKRNQHRLIFNRRACWKERWRRREVLNQGQETRCNVKVSVCCRKPKYGRLHASVCGAWFGCALDVLNDSVKYAKVIKVYLKG